MPFFSDLAFETRVAAQTLAERARAPTLRLGVTGLARSGKTVFITALAHDLLALAVRGERSPREAFPVFRARADGRLFAASLEAQPDDAVPRFPLEEHLAALTGGAAGADARRWPASTQRLSELRLILDFERETGWRRGPRRLTLDIVDYPGEWLLDLPLLDKSYAQWSAETISASETPSRAPLAQPWRERIAGIDPNGAFTEDDARSAAELFTRYLAACRERNALSMLPPGRFLAPGDLEGSPALTFAPLDPSRIESKANSFASMMERRYESYKRHIVRPFFRDHFARLDRQIVLVDALSALNAGPAALTDLELALGDVLTAFRTGRSGLLGALLRPRIDRILFAATKADHLHHRSHDRLEAVLRRLVARSLSRAEGLGARVEIAAVATVRATREVAVREGRRTIDAIAGVPEADETIDGETFDGQREAAIFPGELPEDPEALFADQWTPNDRLRFVRFRPPSPAPGPFPHIRLDRALQFLLGDRLA